MGKEVQYTRGTSDGRWNRDPTGALGSFAHCQRHLHLRIRLPVMISDYVYMIEKEGRIIKVSFGFSHGSG